MTLYDLLIDNMIVNANQASSYFSNDKEFHKYIGRIHMCGDLIHLLSDESLKLEVTTRREKLVSNK